MNVNWVMVHRGEISKADSHPLAEPGKKGRGARISATIERKDVEFYHLTGVGPAGAGHDLPFTKHECVISVWRRIVRFSRMNDKQAKHAESHLRHLVVTRVIHESSVLPDSKFVLEGFAWLDRRLAEAAHAIHSAGHQNAMPVNTRRSRQFVRHIDADAVALDTFDGGAMDLPIEAPAIGSQLVILRSPGDKDMIDLLADEMKDLHAINHTEGKRRAIEGQTRFIVFAWEDQWRELVADDGANYDRHEEIDLSSLEPLIACPSSPGNVVPVREVAGREIYQAYVGSSANPGLRDFAVAARIVEGRHIDGRVSFDINPTSRQILENLTALGFLGKLIRAGARIHQAGCNGCIGMGQAPATGRISLRTVLRNFPAALVLRRIRFIFAVRKLPRLRR